MSNILWKSFNLCISKFKCFPTITLTPPIHEDQDQTHPPITNPKSLFNNFYCLYDFNDSDTTVSASKFPTFSSADEFFSSDDSDTESVPDFTSVFASRRFFFSSPGISNSIVERSVAPPPVPDSGEVVSGGVAVLTCSRDPYTDFRKSMVEMIEARPLKGVKDDWEFLHELLLCYLTLNPKHTHKYILGAFADVIVCIAWPPTGETCRKTHHRQSSDMSRLSI